MSLLLLLSACRPPDTTLSLPGNIASLGEEGLVAVASEGKQSPVLKFVGWKEDGARHPLVPVSTEFCGDLCLQRNFSDVREWVRMEPEGLEQGWTLEQVGGSQLQLDVEVTEGWAWMDGGVVWLQGEDGSIWNYAGLKAYDEEGELPSNWEVVDNRIVMQVDTRGTVGAVEVDPLLTTASATWTGAANDWLGSGIAACDVNADGYEDAVFGAYTAKSAAGRVTVYHGSSSGLSTAASTTINGVGTEEWGASVACEDVNGDGYGDVALVAVAANNNNGIAWVYYGSSTGVATTNATSFGSSAATVHALGDVNGDGYGDLALAGTSGSGGATVYHGSAGGISTVKAMSVIGSGNEDFGASVAGADVNGDGYNDLIVGAPDSTYATYSGQGKVRVYLGSSAGVSTNVATTITGAGNYYHLGATVAGADVNGDGYDDLLTGATNIVGNYSGAVYVYHGSKAGLSTSATTTVLGSSQYEYFGYSLDAGDLNGDGYADMGVGAGFYSVTTGRISTFLGSSTGMSTSYDTAINGNKTYVFGAKIALADFNGDGMEDVITSEFGNSYAGVVYEYLSYGDMDGDGYNSSGSSNADCDDSDASVHPGATETDADGIDSNCDGTENCYGDADNDGYRNSSLSASSDGDCSDSGEALSSAPTNDCDDSNASIHPGASEIPDGIDSDCDSTQQCYADTDGDSYGGSSYVSSIDLDCSDSGEALTVTDCDDGNSNIYPGATDTDADGIDSNCDGSESCYSDMDGDGYRNNSLVAGDGDCSDPNEATASMPSGDCDDAHSTVYPGAADASADGADSNCDGVESCYSDADQDGFRDDTLVAGDGDCSDPGEAQGSLTSGDCDDGDPNINPAASDAPADGIDSNCDDSEDCYVDADDDGYRTESLQSGDGDCKDPKEATEDEPVGDCDDSNADISPGATEIAGDEIDENCDGKEECFTDADGDGYRNETAGPSDDGDCGDAGEALASVEVDCSDADASVSPEGTEVCDNGIDENCDGTADDGCGNGGGDDTGVKDGRDKGLFGCSSSGEAPGAMGLMLAMVALRRRKGA